jgi:hypothetical protein
MLLHETYNSLTCLVELASKIEIQLALTEETIAELSPACENKNVLMRCHLLCVLLCDVDINTSDTSTPTHNQISSPITQTRARQLNNQVSSFLASYSSYLDNRNVCSVLLLRNDGQEGNKVGFARATFGFQNSSTL